MPKVIVIGGFGAVGSHICEHFMARGYTVVAYDLRQRPIPFLQPFGNRFVTELGDVHDLARLRAAVERHGPEGIIDTSDEMKFDDPHGTVHNAADGIANVLELARLNKLKVICLISAAVYGMVPSHDLLITEDLVGHFPIGPVRDVDSLWAPMHGGSKRVKQATMELYRTMYGVDAVSVCISGQVSQVDSRPVPLYDYIRAALEQKPHVVPAGGDRWIDNVYAKDTALGVYLAFTAPRPLGHHFFNIGWEHAYTVSQCAEAVKRAVPSAQVQVGPGVVRNYPSKSYWRGALSTARAQDELGYRPQYNLDSMTRELIAWFRQHPELLPPPHTTAERVPAGVVGYTKTPPPVMAPPRG
jgi:nucleoside-diphosphate-sugar epimerase